MGDGLAGRRLWLTSQGESAWPDGPTARRFRFQQALYHQRLYEHLPEEQRQTLHHFAEQTEAVAAELAMHFDRGSA